MPESFRRLAGSFQLSTPGRLSLASFPGHTEWSRDDYCLLCSKSLFLKGLSWGARGETTECSGRPPTRTNRPCECLIGAAVGDAVRSKQRRDDLCALISPAPFPLQGGHSLASSVVMLLYSTRSASIVLVGFFLNGSYLSLGRCNFSCPLSWFGDTNSLRTSEDLRCMMGIGEIVLM